MSAGGQRHIGMNRVSSVERVLASVALTTTAASAAFTVAVAGAGWLAVSAFAVGALVLALTGSAADAGGRRRWGATGLAAVPAGVLAFAHVHGTAMPEWAVAFAVIVAAAATAASTPPLIALISTGSDRMAPATPRMRIVLGFGSPWPTTARRLERVALPLAAGVGVLVAATWSWAAASGWQVGWSFASTVVVLGAAIWLGCLAVSVRALTRAVAPDRAAEAAARPLLAAAVGSLIGSSLVAALPDGVAGTLVAVLTVLLTVVALVHPTPRHGRLLEHGTRAYARAVRPFARGAHPTPDDAIIATNVDHVAIAIEHATAVGHRVVANTTGHGAAALPDLEGATLISVRIDEPVTLNEGARTVRIPAGTAWGDVVQTIAPTGLIAAHGSSPLVGAVGYLTRGGLSLYGRSSGLAANSIESIEIVTADGQLRLTDAEHDRELFWALRGGGGGFGVITAITARLFPVTALTTGAAFWSIEHAPELLRAWTAWTETAPREASTIFRIMRLPPVPGIPRAIAGRTVVCIDGVVHTRHNVDRDRVGQVTSDLLDPLRDIARPVLDTWRPGTVLDVPWTHMDPAIPLATAADHFLLGPLDHAAQSAFLRRAVRSDAALSTVELRQLGGAFSDAPPGGGALARLEGEYSYFATGLITPSASRTRIEAQLDDLRTAMGPWLTEYTAPNYAEDRARPQRSFSPEIAERVAATRRRVDPTGVFALDVALGAHPRSTEENAG